MKKLVSISAFAALSVAAPIAGALAATIEITGDPYRVRYGTPTPKNNVVNFYSSGLWDLTGRRTTPWLAGGTVLSEVSDYYIDWYFNGAESGDTIEFFAPSISLPDVSFTESNQNNNNQGGNDPGWKPLGTTLGSGLNAPIPFTLTDTNFAMTLENGTLDPDAGSLIFAYAEPFTWHGEQHWKLTLDPTDWFVFAYNDPGSDDKDHDDFIGLGHVRIAEVPPSPVPLPGALPLMGSVIGGGYLLRRWRNRNRRTGSAAAA